MKKTLLLIVMIMILSLSACGSDKNNEAPAGSSAASETAPETKETQEETIQSETEKETTEETETPASAASIPETQPQAEEPFELTEQGKDFLTTMCRELPDFNSQTVKDDKFWCDFLFYSYTGGPLEGFETEQVYREDLGFDETVVKVSLQDAQAHAKLVFGIELPDVKPTFDDMNAGQTSCYFQDGYYYIGLSDFPAMQYTFADYEEADGHITVNYDIEFEGDSGAGTVSFTIVPEDNENGFIITSKTLAFTN